VPHCLSFVLPDLIQPTHQVDSIITSNSTFRTEVETPLLNGFVKVTWRGALMTRIHITLGAE
jgi:hypothetical protein